MKALTVTMPDGSIWAVPVLMVATNRATHYAHEFDGDVERSLAEDTLPLFESDEYEVADWAVNNMNWCDFDGHQFKIKDAPPPDFQEAWMCGDKSVIDIGSTDIRERPAMSGNHNMFCSANNPIQREQIGISECADHLRRHNAWRRGSDSIDASSARELGLNIDFAIAVLDAMSGHDHLMVIAAFRYCLGRMTYIVGDCADWLIKIWPYLSKETQNIIKRDLEEAFTRDDEDREAGRDCKALGHDCDRAEWSRVRKLWENK